MKHGGDTGPHDDEDADSRPSGRAALKHTTTVEVTDSIESRLPPFGAGSIEA